MAKKKRKRPKPHVKIHVGNPESRSGVVVIRVPGKSHRQALANARRFVKHHTKNIEMGFWRGGAFHPIRASKDYSEARAKKGAKASARMYSLRHGMAKPSR